jgi:hypothetical protein
MTVEAAAVRATSPGEVPERRAAVKGGDRPERRRRSGAPCFRRDGRSEEARKIGAAILEVLAGARTPTDAATDLGVSLPRYYQLEARGLEGLVQACEPRERGRKKTPENDLEKTRRELGKLQRECARNQALLRVAQRTVGLSSPPKAPAKPEPGRKRKKRRATARALKAAEVLKREAGGGSPMEKGGRAGDDGAPGHDVR